MGRRMNLTKALKLLKFIDVNPILLRWRPQGHASHQELVSYKTIRCLFAASSQYGMLNKKRILDYL